MINLNTGNNAAETIGLLCSGVCDLKYTGGSQKGGFQLGENFNVSSSFKTKTKSIIFGAKADAYATITKPSTDVGGSLQGFVEHKLGNSTGFFNFATEFDR